jgi:hypothetical protein
VAWQTQGSEPALHLYRLSDGRQHAIAGSHDPTSISIAGERVYYLVGHTLMSAPVGGGEPTAVLTDPTMESPHVNAGGDIVWIGGKSKDVGRPTEVRAATVAAPGRVRVLQRTLEQYGVQIGSNWALSESTEGATLLPLHPEGTEWKPAVLPDALPHPVLHDHTVVYETEANSGGAVTLHFRFLESVVG